MTHVKTGFDIDSLIAWIEEETGLQFPEVHLESIEKTVQARSRELGIQATDYERRLRIDVDERCLFFNRIMIGETYFFRDEKHFSALMSKILPDLLLTRKHIKLWSASCASGEEAISLVAVMEAMKSKLGSECEYSVIASDINQDAISQLSRGVFPLSSLRSDGKIHHGLLEYCGVKTESAWKALPHSLKRLDIRHINLMKSALPEQGSIDIIFFRNTLVYVPQARKAALLTRVLSCLAPGGYLFLSSPEVPTIRHPELSVLEEGGCFFFHKIPDTKLQKPASTTAKIGPSLIRALSSPVLEKVGPSQQELAQGQGQSKKMRPRVTAQELSKGLELSSLWAKNPEAKNLVKPEEGPRACAEILSSIMEAVHLNQYSRADDLIHQFEGLAQESHISLYLRGISHKHQGRLPEAIDVWERCRSYEPKFWPSLFQAGMANAVRDPQRSRELLHECLGALEGRPNETAYFILLEGFDASYYRRMAEKMLLRMKKKD